MAWASVVADWHKNEWTAEQAANDEKNGWLKEWPWSELELIKLQMRGGRREREVEGTLETGMHCRY